MLELYHSPISTCSQKVRLCLAEKGLEFTHRQIDFSTMEQLSDAYLEINPNGVVPTLVHDGRAIVDSSVICEYLDDIWPDPPLAPRDLYERAQMRAWMRYFEEVPTAAIRVPSFNNLFVESIAALDEETFTAMTERMPLRKAFYRQMNGKAGFDQRTYDDSMAKLEATLTRVETTLASTTWISGENFSLADILLVPTVVRMEDMGLSSMWKHRPRVAQWFDTVQQRPSFALAYYEGARVDLNTFEIGLKPQLGSQNE